MSKVFLDTNVLVYAVDQGERRKQEQAIALLRDLDTGNVHGVVSTQVLQEFYVVATRKLGVEPLIAKSLLRDFLRFEVVNIQPSHICEAIDCSILNNLSFWDSMIIVSAESASCTQMWTEDLNDGQIIRGVRIQNPFGK